MFAIISDIHANFEALKTVLNYLKKINVEKIYCLGDLVGYGPEPEKIIQEIQKRKILTCVGNHEAGLLKPELAFNFSPIAKESIRLTKPEISQNSIDYLKTLKMSYNAEKCLFVHSSPFNPQKWDYIYYPGQAAPVFKHFKESVCFIGHTHSPVVLCNDGQCDFSYEVSLNVQKKYLINVGSVGQPRDGDPRACFVLFDRQKKAVKFIRLDYNIEKTREKIKSKNLPEFLAERLIAGR